MFSACPTSFAKKKQKLNYNGESCLVLEKQFALFETFAKGFRLTAELVEDRSKADIFTPFTPEARNLLFVMCICICICICISGCIYNEGETIEDSTVPLSICNDFISC